MAIVRNGKTFKVADAHAHIYPHKIAAKATDAVGAFYDIPMDLVGSSEILKEYGTKAGTDRYLVCSVATKPEQVRSINDFIAGECREHPEFVGFAAFHQDLEDYDAMVQEIADGGFYGIKLHPDFQKFNIDDERMMQMYRAAAKFGLTVLFHMGDDRYDFSSPERLLRVVEQVPDFKCIAAHFGGYRVWKDAFHILNGTDVYFDTSSSLDFITAEDAVEMIRGYGYERMLYGTDFPMWNPVTELERFFALGLTDEENKAILYDNFAGLLGIE